MTTWFSGKTYELHPVTRIVFAASEEVLLRMTSTNPFNAVLLMVSKKTLFALVFVTYMSLSDSLRTD